LGTFQQFCCSLLFSRILFYFILFYFFSFFFYFINLTPRFEAPVFTPRPPGEKPAVGQPSKTSSLPVHLFSPFGSLSNTPTILCGVLCMQPSPGGGRKSQIGLPRSSRQATAARAQGRASWPRLLPAHPHLAS